MKTHKCTTAAFTGHRSFKMAGGGGDLFARPESPEEITVRLREAIAGLAAEGYTDFLCGMAEGFDLLAGETVLSLKREYGGIRLIAVVPFPGQAAGFGHEARERYAEVLAGAAEIVTVCQHYSADCFHRRNDYLTDNASALVCYYNGSKGGTQYTVKRALKNGLRIINVI